MGKVDGYNTQRNSLGAIVYESPSDDKTLYCFTQLFLSREIWAIDGRTLNQDFQRALYQSQDMHFNGNYIPSIRVEEQFVIALHNYMSCARTHLLIPAPVRIEAGLVAIKGYRLADRENRIVGNALHDTAIWQGEANYETPAWELLEPFFKRLWANCDIVRPPGRQAELTRQFRNALRSGPP